MEILDAQIHCWLTDHPSRPWIPGYRKNHRNQAQFLIHAGQSAGPETVLIAMAEAGVDAGVLTPVGVYGDINGFELDAAQRFPRKFGVMGWIDHLSTTMEQQLRDDVARGMLGVRLLGLREPERHARREFDWVLRLCEELGAAVSFSLAHPVDPQLVDVFQKYSGINFVIDHLGVGQAPPLLRATPEEPWQTLPAVLDLAKFSNVSLKLTGAPSLSFDEFPFRDLWDPIARILDAYGPERVMWGSDFTRTNGLHSYWEATHYLAEVPGLDTAALEQVYGRTLRRILRWPPLDPVAVRNHRRAS
ncbi:amidohydrolase [Rhodococcus sp. NCIMB 12038]|uniref:amidohydrolase family protein n=1 Tax=Rhodococcus sp. NCIMB 12038 TaxID=933800 RepID=UPI000B3D0978|nr:amidohydrolase family protein [Rhodococcus sp. NCIMB 12038]OUS92120.1 hypothetical protein CA951_29880 [Rhodococcus sp. NCIMB 12038]